MLLIYQVFGILPTEEKVVFPEITLPIRNVTLTYIKDKVRTVRLSNSTTALRTAVIPTTRISTGRVAALVETRMQAAL